MVVMIVMKSKLSIAIANKAISAFRTSAESNSMADHVPSNCTNARVDQILLKHDQKTDLVSAIDRSPSVEYFENFWRVQILLRALRIRAASLKYGRITKQCIIITGTMYINFNFNLQNTIEAVIRTHKILTAPTGSAACISPNEATSELNCS